MWFKCSSCSFTTMHPGHVPRHERTVHSELRPWECSYPGCQYAAKTRCGLTRHLKSHPTNPKLRMPYCCTFKGCEYRAISNGNLKQHKRRWHVLNRITDFGCSFCSSRFYDKNVLNVHIRSHVKEKRFECLQFVVKRLQMAAPFSGFHSTSSSGLRIPAHARLISNSTRTVSIEVIDCFLETMKVAEVSCSQRLKSLTSCACAWFNPRQKLTYQHVRDFWLRNDVKLNTFDTSLCRV